MTKRQKRIKRLKEKLSFYEGKLYQHMSDFEDETESIISNTKHQEFIMLNVAVDDIRKELDELES